jgi:alkyl hydroperoxide reductase subunit AhpC
MEATAASTSVLVPGLGIRRPAPNFQAVAYFNHTMKPVSLADYAGKYVVLFFYPLDFTFVCPTEIIQFGKKAADFKAINCEVIGCSIDSPFVHMEWCKKPRAEGGLGELEVPLLADVTKKIAKDYGCLLEHTADAGVALRYAITTVILFILQLVVPHTSSIPRAS